MCRDCRTSFRSPRALGGHRSRGCGGAPEPRHGPGGLTAGQRDGPSSRWGRDLSAQEDDEELVEEAEGWRLHMSKANSSGYTGVTRKANGSFEAKMMRNKEVRRAESAAYPA